MKRQRRRGTGAIIEAFDRGDQRLFPRADMHPGEPASVEMSMIPVLKRGREINDRIRGEIMSCRASSFESRLIVTAHMFQYILADVIQRNDVMPRKALSIEIREQAMADFKARWCV
jgi:hypothetical protein